MTTTPRTIRIVDYRQRKGAKIWSALLSYTLIPSGLFWPGILAGSPAMQWAGFVIFLILTFTFACRWLDEYLTPDEARKRIDEISPPENADLAGGMNNRAMRARWEQHLRKVEGLLDQLDKEHDAPLRTQRTGKIQRNNG